jgi:hypothetical protein
LKIEFIVFYIRYLNLQIMKEFWPGGSEAIREGIGAAFRAILEKKVLQSLDTVLENNKLEPELRNSIQASLYPLIQKGSLSSTSGLGNDLETPMLGQDSSRDPIQSADPDVLSPSSRLNHSTAVSTPEADFSGNSSSDEEEDGYSPPVKEGWWKHGIHGLKLVEVVEVNYKRGCFFPVS